MTDPHPPFDTAAARQQQEETELIRLRRENHALRTSEQLLRLSQRIATIGSWEWEFGTNSVRWSDEMFRIFGIRATDFDGTPEAAVRFFHPEDRPAAEAAVRNALEQGLSNTGTEYRVVRPDGSERIVWGQGDVVRDEQGHPLRMVGTILDITERKRAAEALRDSDRRLRQALDAASMGTWEWMVAEDRVLWSPRVEQLFGLGPGGFRGTLDAYLSLVHAEDVPRVRRAARTLREGGGKDDYEIEHRICLPDGNIRWIAGKGRVFRDAEGRPLKMTGTVADATDRKDLELRLLRSQRMESIGRLAGGIAHDFNNLLTVIFGGLERAESSVSSGREVRDSLSTIRAASERARRLTGQLLSFARRQVVNLRTVDVNALVSDVGRLLRRVLGEDIELRTELGGQLWHVKADPAQLEQVLLNFAVNAREAMPDGGRLVIRTSNVLVGEQRKLLSGAASRGEYVRLVVQDTGHGMNEEVLQNAFEPFFTTKQEGSGLGLASSYGIVTQIGGNLRVESRPGDGATFTIDLPRTTEALDDAREEPRVESRRRSETVMVVEDEPAVRELLVQGLQNRGHVVLEAADGRQALDAAVRHEGEIHVLVTDVVMPMMGGTELARRMRDSRPETKVLLISGYSDDLHRTDDIDDLPFLQKPFSPSELAEKVRQLLEPGT